jgi:hypothetical protein
MDIWSWAVTALEMYLGSRPWANGAVAGYGCDMYFVDAKIPVPEGSFKEDEKERPHDFEIVEKELLTIYQDEFQQPYPRPVPGAADLSAGSLNNRALSFLDIGKAEEAEKSWKKALEKEA